MISFKPGRFETYFHAICATAITFVLVSARTVLAVDGDLDPTFGADGKVLTDFDHSTDIANAVAIQADGKLVVVGTTYRDNDFSNEDFAVARYNPDGTLDKTFGAGGKVQTDFPGLAAVASSVVIQPACCNSTPASGPSSISPTRSYARTPASISNRLANSLSQGKCSIARLTVDCSHRSASGCGSHLNCSRMLAGLAVAAVVMVQPPESRVS